MIPDAVKPNSHSPVRAWELFLFLSAAVGVCLFYALYTGQIWEDFFITFRHSKNLVEGNGLVYQPGERVHGFTSPLGALLPALIYWAAGQKSYVPVIWIFRLVCTAAFAAGGLFLIAAVPSGKNQRSVRRMLGLFYLLQVKAVAFSTNGMETGLMLLFVGWTLYLLENGSTKHWLAAGPAFAGLMWTRPDGCVYIASLCAGWSCFLTEDRKSYLKFLLRSAGVGAVLYLPWFVFAWVYYGSPVPHTVTAKSPILESSTSGPCYFVLSVLERFPNRITMMFAPYSMFYGNWPGWVRGISLALGVFAAIYWLLPLNDSFGRRASFTFALLSAYLCYPHPYEWYFPPAAMCGLAAVASGLGCLADKASGWFRHSGFLALAICVLILVEMGYVFRLTSIQMRLGQEVIDMGNRAKVGLWLKEHADEGDTTYLESLGYIGYFSNGKMLDYPGLVAPEVVAVRRERKLDFFSALLALKPDWAVLRSLNAKKMEAMDAFRKNYRKARTFNVTRELLPYKDHPGINSLVFDASFTIYRRKEN